MVSQYLGVLSIFCFVAIATSGSLDPNFYGKICPQALPAIKRVVFEAVRQERRMGASLLRLHFHDCFVNGCDGSILLDSTSSFTSEKFSLANNNSARGFEVVDRIKWEVDRVCRRPVVSCADILAVAARDSVVALGGPYWKVEVGRRDSTTASISRADTDIPAPFMNRPQLIDNFRRQGLDVKDLVVLSGGHTLGFSQCRAFRTRVYNDNNIDSTFARQLRTICPRTGGDSNIAPFDPTPARFDAKYFSSLTMKKGLLQSDQALFGGGGETDSLVKEYSSDHEDFAEDFAKSMIKMGNIKPLTGNQGQIRFNCRRAN